MGKFYHLCLTFVRFMAALLYMSAFPVGVGA